MPNCGTEVNCDVELLDEEYTPLSAIPTKPKNCPTLRLMPSLGPVQDHTYHPRRRLVVVQPPRPGEVLLDPENALMLARDIVIAVDGALDENTSPECLQLLAEIQLRTHGSIWRCESALARDNERGKPWS